MARPIGAHIFAHEHGPKGREIPWIHTLNPVTEETFPMKTFTIPVVLIALNLICLCLGGEFAGPATHSITSQAASVFTHGMVEMETLPGFQNGSFEINGGDSSSIAERWIIQGQALIRFLEQEGSTEGAFAALFNPGFGLNGSVLSQTFSTEPGQRYRVLFDWGNHGADATQRLKVEALDAVSGQPLLISESGAVQVEPDHEGVQIEENSEILLISDSTGSTDSVRTPAPNSKFSSFTFLFRAGSSTTTLAFTDLGTGDLPSSDGILDNVRLMPAEPELSIRASEVEISWESADTDTYQIQYRSELTDNQWRNLGEPVLGDGNHMSVHDAVEPDRPRRFYRIVVNP